MEWIARLNQAVRCLEDHLTEETDYERLGRIACCSAYHFQRMFAYMAGIPLSEYIRRRRMSLAAVDLQGGARVIDVAAKYGYRSPTAFNRAFRSVHGVAPSAVRSGKAYVKSFPPLSFSIVVKGVEALEYRIETKGAFRIVGVSAPLHRELEQNFAVVPTLWQDCAADGTLERLIALADGAPAGLLGVSLCPDGAPWRYFVAVPSSRPAPGLEEYEVPAAVWAVFPGSGTNRSVQELERRIFTEWLPASGYEYGDAPDLEVYLNPDPDDTVFEIWVPVRPKLSPAV